MHNVPGVLMVAVFLATIFCFAGQSALSEDASASALNPRSFAGYRALFIPPEHPWCQIYHDLAFEEFARRGFDFLEGKPEDLSDPATLEGCDIVVVAAKRSFTPEQVSGLRAYLSSGGALYATWGGPMSCPELLAICGAKSAASIRTDPIQEFLLPDGPLSAGLKDRRMLLPAWAGHSDQRKTPPELVAFEALDGLVAVEDPKNRCLGLLKEHGRGRSAVLGFAPEDNKRHMPDLKAATVFEDNLLAWLLPSPPRDREGSNVLLVRLPRNCRVLSVSVNETAVKDPSFRTRGSLNTLRLPVAMVKEGEELGIRVSYSPLARASDIETWMHFPCDEFSALGSPAKVAAFLREMHVDVVQPLLRGPGGYARYRPCLPGDRVVGTAASYKGDFLGECIRECHKAGIKVVGGMYLSWGRSPDLQINGTAPLKVGKDGLPVKEEGMDAVCPLDDKVRERNFEVVRHFLKQYADIDALMLDDNFEFDQKPCYCDACKTRYRVYCEDKGAPYQDPATLGAASAGLWTEFWKAEVMKLLTKVHALCKERGKQLGGWRSYMADAVSTEALDFHGAMVYMYPAFVSRRGLSAMPEGRDYITLLWGMERTPEDILIETAQAIRAGNSKLGFWIRFQRLDTGSNNKWGIGWDASKPSADGELRPGTLEAITRAFAAADDDWQSFYRENLIGGDRRFAVISGAMKRDTLSLQVKNMGKPTERRVIGPMDFSGFGEAKRVGRK